jgi:hypothetical protein
MGSRPTNGKEMAGVLLKEDVPGLVVTTSGTQVIEGMLIPGTASRAMSAALQA